MIDVKLSILKLSTGETIIGEVLKNYQSDQSYYILDYPFTITQNPATNSNGGYSEMILMFPFLYKFCESGTVLIKKEFVVSEPTPANESFTKLYKINFIKQTLHDVRQCDTIEELYAETYKQYTRALH